VCPHHLRYATRIIAAGLVDLRVKHRPHVPRLDTDRWQGCFRKRMAGGSVGELGEAKTVSRGPAIGGRA